MKAGKPTPFPFCILISIGAIAFAVPLHAEVVYTFNGNDGRYPVGTLIQDGSLLYGVTSSAGSGNNGNLFAFNSQTRTLQTLYSFTGGDDAQPFGSLIQSGSNLYGTTSGKSSANNGTIYAFNLQS